MRIWVTVFILLFAATELLQWLKEFSLPLPVFIVSGVFLAVASNYETLVKQGPLFDPDPLEADPPTVSSESPSPAVAPAPPSPPPAAAFRQTSISFTIRRAFHPGRD